MFSIRCVLLHRFGSTLLSARSRQSGNPLLHSMASCGNAATAEIDQDYQSAVKALNGLQTSAADLLEQKKQDSSVKEQGSWREEHRHSEAKAKLLHTQQFLQRSGIQLADLERLKAVHVTGTKGKGSVCAMCEIILRKHKLKTGFFSSPHLLEVRERIRLNGTPLSKETFVSYFWDCFNKLKESEDRDLRMPTYFKFLTVMAFHVFLKEKVDVAIVEVGIGGAFDCTNILPKPAVCAISSLGYDHMEVLGETLEKIAWQKGGIFKPDCPAFTTPQFPGPMKVLAERALELGASSLRVAPPLNEYSLLAPPPKLGLAGQHQQANASLAVQACGEWLRSHGNWTQESCVPPESSCVDGTDVPIKQLHGVAVARLFMLTQEFREGLEQCWWPGRNQIIRKGRVTYYLDGAHTPQSIKSCVEWFKVEASKEGEDYREPPCVRILLFNTTKKRDPKLLMQALLDCGFQYAVFTPNVAYPEGTNSADQTNLMVPVESQYIFNHQAWLEVNHCNQEPVEAVVAASSHAHGHGNNSVTSAPDPLVLCVGSRTKGGAANSNFEAENARVFACISDAVAWCDASLSKLTLSSSLVAPAAPRLPAGGRMQILVTGSLHLVGVTMRVLGCKVEDL